MRFSYKLGNYEVFKSLGIRFLVETCDSRVLKGLKYKCTVNELAIIHTHTANTLTCTDDLTRLANSHELSCRNTLKPIWQNFSACNFDICGFTNVIIVVLNSKFKLVSFYKLIFAAFVWHLYFKFSVN
jgi:hypothetical protein